MPLSQLLTSLAIVREAIGNPVSERTDFSDNLHDGTPLLHFFNWAFNSSVDFSIKEINNVDVNNIETTTKYNNNSTPKYPESLNGDSLSIMWYLASFGTLVMFFLLISFSEVCCKKSLAMQQEVESEVSPPSYDLFAPPTYESLYEEKKEKNGKAKKNKYDVFVINVFGDDLLTAIKADKQK